MAKAWKEKVTIPTYEVGTPEKAPMFLEKRVYQGSSGVVYPYPVIESISDEKRDVEYDAIYLENEYLKVMILPSWGWPDRGYQAASNSTGRNTTAPAPTCPSTRTLKSMRTAR